MNDKANSIAQSRSWLSDPENLAILDCETTGLRSNDEIVEISIIDGNGKVLMDRLVKPTISVPKDAAAIHGISNEMLAEERAWPELKEEFERVIAGKTVAIYNSGYDSRLIEQTYSKHGLTLPADIKNLLYKDCVMETYAAFYGEWDDYREQYKWQKLTNAAKQCGVANDGAHRALSDIRMTLGVIKHMANQ